VNSSILSNHENAYLSISSIKVFSRSFLAIDDEDEEDWAVDDSLLTVNFFSELQSNEIIMVSVF